MFNQWNRTDSDKQDRNRTDVVSHNEMTNSRGIGTDWEPWPIWEPRTDVRMCLEMVIGTVHPHSPRNTPQSTTDRSLPPRNVRQCRQNNPIPCVNAGGKSRQTRPKCLKLNPRVFNYGVYILLLSTTIFFLNIGAEAQTVIIFKPI